MIDEARALGRAMAQENKRPSPLDIARAFAEGFGSDPVNVKTLLADPRFQPYRDRHGVREKHLRDALRAIRDAERQADRAKSGIAVPKRRSRAEVKARADQETAVA
ncbi:hypothetical protein [Sphingomonas hankookensis]|uniref:hypothetical protein n=1 Tax=Sphingomonas hankookensis TaxID=563996 RepID=UPI003F7A18EA